MTYKQIYPGVDLRFHGEQGHLEYDFVLSPGADPALIKLGFDGANAVELDHGDLALQTPAGVIRQAQPSLYQEVDGVRQTIGGR